MPAQRLDDPHLEGSGLPDWTLGAGASVNAAGRSGNAVLLLSSKSGLVTVAGTLTQTGLDIRSGWKLQPTAWVRLVSTKGNDADLRIRVDKGDGVFTDYTVDVTGVSTTDWFLVTAPELAAVGSVGRYRVDVTTRSVNGSTAWLVDDCSLLAMAKTIAIRDAIVLDFKDITTANGFATDVASEDVFEEPTDLTERGSDSAIMLAPAEGGESDEETITNRIGATVQRFGFEAMVRSATPHTSASNLLDDIRNAVERTTSNVNGVANVDAVTVSEWDDVKTSGDLGNLVGIVTGTISVAYSYTRGSV